jgi:hypothetical protein
MRRERCGEKEEVEGFGESFWRTRESEERVGESRGTYLASGGV